jgi:MSHA biogenesis protein MshI
MLNRPHGNHWRIGVLPGESQTAVAVVRARKDGRPFLKHCSVHAVSDSGAEGPLVSLTRERSMARVPVSAVVRTEDYQLVQVEAPEVLPSEMRAAVRWRLKDAIDFDIDAAVFDVFEIPEPPRRTQSRMMYAVAARSEAIQRVSGVVAPYARGFDVIEIPELCQRNLSTLLPYDKKGVALLTLADKFAQLTLTRDGVLYLTRRIELARSYDMPRRSDASSNSDTDASALALEVQRSLDYYESHYDHTPIGNLVIAPGDDRASALATELRKEMSLQIELFNIADLFEIDAGLSIDSDWQSLMALGAALRNDKVRA